MFQVILYTTHNCGPWSASQPATNNATPKGLDMTDSSPCAPSPNLKAKSHIDCVQLSTLSFSLKLNAWFCVSTLACSIILLASACRPDIAQPICLSISTIFSMLDETSKEDVTLFSTPRRTPWDVATPMAVEPSLIASNEYSTWKRRPSGENVLCNVSDCCFRPGNCHTWYHDLSFISMSISTRLQQDVPYSDLAMNILPVY